MPPIAVGIAVVVAAYLTLVTIVVFYLAFVVADRRDVERAGDESAEASVATVGSAH